MIRLVCEDCGKVYNYEVDDFCPRCGAFNHPPKLTKFDARGHVVRVDGVNEQNHAESFSHEEIHTERRVRQKLHLDQPAKKKVQAAESSRVFSVSTLESKIGVLFGVIILVLIMTQLLAFCAAV